MRLPKFLCRIFHKHIRRTSKWDDGLKQIERTWCDECGFEDGGFGGGCETPGCDTALKNGYFIRFCSKCRNKR